MARVRKYVCIQAFLNSHLGMIHAALEIAQVVLVFPEYPLLVSVLDGDVELRIRYMQLTQEYHAQSGASTRKWDTFATVAVPFLDVVQRELKGYSWSHDFSQQKFLSSWQNRAFDAMQTLLAVNTMAAVIDFAMNWFFNPLSATLVPVVLTMRQDRVRGSIAAKKR